MRSRPCSWSPSLCLKHKIMKIPLFKTLVVLYFAVIVMSAPLLLRVNSMGPDSTTSFSGFTIPQNLGTVTQSADNDELAVLSPNGLSLYFASTRPGGSGAFDIYVTQRQTVFSAWGPPQNLGTTVNTSSGDSPASISPDGREMFLNSQRPGGSGGVDIWVMTRTDPNNDLGWTTPVNVGPAVNSNSADQNATYFVDPSTGLGTLFFTSDRGSTTAGVKDVYRSSRNADGSFEPPTPVTELNSTGDEARVAISRDGLELFVDSNRLGPATTFAIFTATRPSVISAWNRPIYVSSLSGGGNARQPFLSADGTLMLFTSNRPGGTGGGDLYSSFRSSINRNATADFDGDGRADLSVFRPQDGVWYILQSSDNTFRMRNFGIAGDTLVPADYDGDGRTDMAVFRSSNSNWYIWKSSEEFAYFSVTNWGQSADRPVPADYDGDGRTDIAVYRGGIWHILQSSDGRMRTQEWGVATDVPIPSVP